MYKARTVVNNLVPFLPSVVGRDRFASWLSSSSRNFATSRACFRSTEVSADPFLNGSSSSYVEEMYNAWLENPKSVHKSWDTFFRSSAAGLSPGLAYQSPPTLAEPSRNHVPISSLVPFIGGANAGIGTTVDEKIIDDHLAVQAIIRS
ncbi:hypothetical protein ACFE04_019805 [Oxalis oulophora]